MSDKQGPPVKWKPDDLVEVIRMIGLVSASAQADHLGRTEVSRKAALRTHFKLRPGDDLFLHGLPKAAAQVFVDSEAEFLYLKARARYFCLWVEIEKHLKPGLPDFMVQTAQAMASFQRWIYKTDKVDKVVKKMVAEREIWD